MDGMQNLCSAVVVQAAKDYRTNACKLRKNPEDTGAQAGVRELEQFFHSNWFTVLSGTDGSYILERLQKEVA